MVEQHYTGAITEISERELRPVTRLIEPPACLLGGWAVYFHVTPGFRAEHDREYIGSRDIDLGFHVDPAWTETELLDSPIGVSIDRIQEHGYDPLSFRFVRHFDRETSDPLTPEEANATPQHNIFSLYLDLVADTRELDRFRDALGFTPVAEELLQHVFDGRGTEPLNEFVDWDAPDSIMIVSPGLLAGMKIRSIPDRTKDHKLVKDVLDLYALLWYIEDLDAMLSAARSWVTDEDVEAAQRSITDADYDSAASLVGIDADQVKNTINRL